MKRILTASVAAMTVVAHAQAASVLASGHLYGGPALNQVACYVNNVGPKAVAVTSVSIFNTAGESVGDTFCDKSLGKGGLCFVYANGADPNQLYSCNVTANLLGTLRGSIEMRSKTGSGNSNITVLNSQPLR